MARGSGLLPEMDAAAKTMRMLRDYFAPDAPDLAYRDAASCPRNERTAHTTDEYLVKFDLLRRMAESRTRPGGSVPEG